MNQINVIEAFLNHSLNDENKPFVVLNTIEYDFLEKKFLWQARIHPAVWTLEKQESGTNWVAQYDPEGGGKQFGLYRQFQKFLSLEEFIHSYVYDEMKHAIKIAIDTFDNKTIKPNFRIITHVSHVQHDPLIEKKLLKFFK